MMVILIYYSRSFTKLLFNQNLSQFLTKKISWNMLCTILLHLVYIYHYSFKIIAHLFLMDHENIMTECTQIYISDITYIICKCLPFHSKEKKLLI